MSESELTAVKEVRFFSPSLGKSLRYLIILPKRSERQTLPVLYFLHGANSTPEEILRESPILKLTEQMHLAVVLPDTNYSYYTDARYRVHSKWEQAIVSDLQSDAQHRFPVSAAREKTAIAGISMGGYGAVKLALKHPEKFSFVGSLSGPFDITRRRLSIKRLGQSLSIALIFGLYPSQRNQEDVFWLLSKSKVTGVRWFIACGRQDPLYSVNLRFANNLLREHGVVDVVSQRSGHDWQSWNEAMPRLMDEVNDRLNFSTSAKSSSDR